MPGSNSRLPIGLFRDTGFSMRRVLLIFFSSLSLAVPGGNGLDTLELAETALRTRMIESAESRFAEVIDQTEDPVERFQGLLGLARARLARGRVEEAASLLSELPSAPETQLGHQANLLRADVAILQGDVEQADALLAITPPLTNDWETLRIRLLARKHFLAGETAEALALLKDKSGEPLLLLEHADLLYRSGKDSEALELWAGLAEGPPMEVETQQALLEIAGVHADRDEWTRASQVLDRLIRQGGVREEFEADVYPILIRSLEQAGAYAEAADYLRAFEQKIGDDSLKGRLQAKRAQNLIRGGELEAADRQLREWIALRGDQPELAAVQLLLANTYMERGDLKEAKDAYRRYLSVFTDPQGSREAEAGLAKVEESLGNAEEAERLYGRAWNASLKEGDPAPVLLLKWGDMALTLDRVEEAIQRFELFLDRYPAHDLAPLAQLQLATAIAVRNVPAALDLLTQLRLKYPDTETAERALLHRAVILDRALRLEQALGAYDAYLERHPQGVFAVDAMTDKGIAAYRLGLFDLALRLFRQVRDTYPDHARAEQAASLIGWSYYLKGMDVEARRAGEAFLTRYPESTFAPDVRFWLAEVAFNHGEFDRASEEFLKLTREDIAAPLQSKAHYLAGRSLLAAKNLEPALEQFVRARSVHPEAPHAEDALFYHGDALTELGRFDEAILIFDQLIRAYPDSYLVYAARGRMGDCQYTLGEKDPTRYLEALNTYKSLEESKEASLELRIQAMFKIGRTLNALDREGEARSRFLKMLHLYMRHRGRLGAEAGAWFVRGVAETAQSYERMGEYREAIKVYRLLVESGLPQAGEGARRIEDLRREHLILF